MLIRCRNLLISLYLLLITACATLSGGINEKEYITSAHINLESSPSTSIESSTAIIKIDPSNADAYYLRAMAYQKMNNPQMAESDFKQAIRLSSGNESYMISYANLLCTQQDYNKAQAYYDQAYNHAKQTGHYLTMTYIYNGDCLTTQNKLDPAITSYTNALADESAPVTAYIGIAHAYLLQENYPVANYYLDLYKGTPNKQYLQLKLITLNALLKSGIKLADRNKLEQSRTLIKQQLGMTEPDQDKVIDKPSIKVINLKETGTTKIITPLEAPSSNSKNLACNKLNPRVKTSKTGKNYILIQPGDTLFRISLDCNITASQLKQINHLKNNEVVLGSKLFLN